MEDKTILKKAIEKAVKNGYVPKCKSSHVDMTDEKLSVIKIHAYRKESLYFFVEFDGDHGGWMTHCYEIIFSHSFAKAFFGEENGSPCIHSMEKNDECITGWHWDKDRPKNEGYYPAWQYHLQVMVLEENPIQYLGRFL